MCHFNDSMRPALIIAVIIACGSYVSADDSLLVKRHCVGIDPISACMGTLSANYEYMAGRNGFVLEGGYAVPIIQEYTGGSAAYRFHLTKSALGPFFGPYLKAGKLAQKMQFERGGPLCKYTFTFASAGVNWGKRGGLWKKHGLFYTYRVGAGYPFKSSLQWDIQPPESFNGMRLATFEKIIKFSSFLDSELTMSFVF